MPAYALVELSIFNRDKMSPYLTAVGDTITAHGGRYLVRPGNVEVVEGTLGQYPLKVVLEFPDMIAARQWYDSPEYQAILPNRLEHSEGNFLLVEGV
jgi:uncharacterized protein (DUF1330 family)